MSENITAAQVKELRERTGVGMSKCKDALVRASGSIDQAIEILRKEGMASAVKKEGREIVDFSRIWNPFLNLTSNGSGMSLMQVKSIFGWICLSSMRSSYPKWTT